MGRIGPMQLSDNVTVIGSGRCKFGDGVGLGGPGAVGCVTILSN